MQIFNKDWFAMSTNAVVINYPNYAGDPGRYTLIDQRNYFSKFDCGARYFFEQALIAVIRGNLFDYDERCCQIFEDFYERKFLENTTELVEYYNDRQEFRRRIFDIYRYAKTSVDALGPVTWFSEVRELKSDKYFDTGSFLLS